MARSCSPVTGNPSRENGRYSTDGWQINHCAVVLVSDETEQNWIQKLKANELILRGVKEIETRWLKWTKRLSHKPGFSLKITGKDVVFGAKQDLWDSL